MLIHVRVNNENQALEFINDVLQELGLDKSESLNYSHKKLEICPEQRSEHLSEGPKDITLESYTVLNITVDDLDFETQEIIKKHKYMLHRL